MENESHRCATSGVDKSRLHHLFHRCRIPTLHLRCPLPQQCCDNCRDVGNNLDRQPLIFRRRSPMKDDVRTVGI